MKTVSEALQRVVRGKVLLEEPLARYTTVRIGGPAEIFVEAACEEDIVAVRRIATETGTPLRVLGNGSNVLVSDAGVRGIVLGLGRNFADVRFTGSQVTCQAGVLLPRLAKLAAERGLSGIEFGGGVPGTVGGAIVMNAGAHGGEMADITRRVRVVTQDGSVEEYEREELGFAYRRSRFSGDRNTIVVGGTFILRPDEPAAIKVRMRQFARRRRSTQPLGLPSSGSVFKNPPGDFAGRLVEQAGLKGTQIGQAMVSLAHGNFIVNCGGATASDVLRLIDLVRQRVHKEFGIELELEVELVGM